MYSLKPATIPERGLLGISFCCGALLLFALQDAIIKLLSERYPVWQLAFFRTLVIVVAIAATLAIRRDRNGLKTRRLGMHLLRGALAFCSYTAYYVALAAMPLVNAAAIYATAPLFLTALSVLLLGERVGERRWTAVVLGCLGMLIMLRPGSDVAQAASLLALLSAVLYASSAIVTRLLGTTEPAVSMAFYGNLVYLAGSAAGAAVAALLSAPDPAHPSAAFLLRPWSWPDGADLGWILLMGLLATGGFIGLAQGYRLAAVSTVAPFEYTYLVWSLLLGFVVFGHLPTAGTIAGVLVIVASGVYVIRREAALARGREDDSARRPRRPRRRVRRAA